MAALDRPVWWALTTRQRAFAESAGGAVRMRATVGPFAAAADASRIADLLPLIAPGEEIMLVEPERLALPSSLVMLRSLETMQMVAPNPPTIAPDPDLVVLDEADADEMHALVTLTRPGPFAVETHRLGRFVGLREQGRLVAMAGERMRLDGFTEASGICTHPDARGRGLARRLLGDVIRAIVARGETPFLHCYAANHAAIALYESLGFRQRAIVQAITIARA